MLAFVRAFIQQGTRQNVSLFSSTNQRRLSTQSSAIENNSWRVRSKFHPSIGWSALIAHADCKLQCRGVFLFTNGPLCTLSEVSFSIMSSDSNNLVLKRIGTYDLTGNRLGKGNFAYVELATNRITNSKVGCRRFAFSFQSPLQIIVRWLNYSYCQAM